MDPASLVMAAEKGNVKIVRMLLDAGCGVNIWYKVRGGGGNCARCVVADNKCQASC